MASIASSQPVLRQLEGFGLRLLAFELPGHGQAAGERYTIGEFSDYGRALAAALERECDLSLGPTYLVAHSLGAVAVLEALRQGLQADGVVLVAPLLRLRNHGLTALGVNILAPFTRVLPGGTPVSWFRAYQRWQRQGLPVGQVYPPTSIIGSQRDTVVSNSAMKKLAGTNSSVEYVEIPAIGHWEIDFYDSTSPLWPAIENAIENAIVDLMNQGRTSK